MKIINTIFNPNYCCDGYNWLYDHYRCKNLIVDHNTFELKCKKNMKLDEDQMPPEMDCIFYNKSNTIKSIYSTITIEFKDNENKKKR